MSISLPLRLVALPLGFVLMAASMGACGSQQPAEEPDSTFGESDMEAAEPAEQDGTRLVTPRKQPSKPRDQSALSKIDEAVNQLYLGEKIEEAEAKLLGIIRACEDECSKEVKARGWMYVGIVRGSGSHDQDGARDAFEKALEEDSAVMLDEALTTPDTLETFNSTRSD